MWYYHRFWKNSERETMSSKNLKLWIICFIYYVVATVPVTVVKYFLYLSYNWFYTYV
jgi:hypothetical protein